MSCPALLLISMSIPSLPYFCFPRKMAHFKEPKKPLLQDRHCYLPLRKWETLTVACQRIFSRTDQLYLPIDESLKEVKHRVNVYFFLIIKVLLLLNETTVYN